MLSEEKSHLASLQRRGHGKECLRSSSVAGELVLCPRAHIALQAVCLEGRALPHDPRDLPVTVPCVLLDSQMLRHAADHSRAAKGRARCART